MGLLILSNIAQLALFTHAYVNLDEAIARE